MGDIGAGFSRDDGEGGAPPTQAEWDARHGRRIPWAVENQTTNDGEPTGNFCINGPDGRALALVSSRTVAESQATACLMAAAPELLAALVKAYPVFRNTTTGDEMQAVIRKATGAAQ